VGSCGRGSCGVVLGRRSRSGESLGGPVLRGTSAIEAGAEGREDIRHVLHEIVFHLGLVHYDKPPASRRQRRLHVFGAGASEAVSMLDNDGLHCRIGQQAHDLAAMADQPGAYLRYRRHDCQLFPRGVVGKPPKLAFQIGFLVRARHAGIERDGIHGRRSRRMDDDSASRAQPARLRTSRFMDMEVSILWNSF
jgi:hypothetical protein